MKFAAFTRIALATCLLAGLAQAAPPDLFFLEGILTDAQGDPISGTRNYRVRLFDAPTLGFQIGSNFTGSTAVAADGRFILEIGPIAALIENEDAVYVEIAVDSDVPANGVDADDVFAGRSRLLSSPYALETINSAELGGIPAAGYLLDTEQSLQGAYTGGRTINATPGAVDISGTAGQIGLVVQNRAESREEIRVTNAANTQQQVTLGRDNRGGFVEIRDEAGNLAINSQPANTDGTPGGVIAVQQTNPTLVGVGLLGDPLGGNKGGQVVLFNAAQRDAALISVGSVGQGAIDLTNGANTNYVTNIGINGNNDGLILFNRGSTGDTRVAIGTVPSAPGTGSGILEMVRDSDGGLTVLLDGSDGSVNSLVKNFVVPHPSRSDKMIRYTCIEGPEAAIYARGSVTLQNGRAKVVFPDHFASMASPDTVTVSLTPGSLDSMGVAAVDVTTEGFVAGELARGTGSYRVDWVAYAVRRGYEDRPIEIDRATWEARRPRLKRDDAVSGADLLAQLGQESAR